MSKAEIRVIAISKHMYTDGWQIMSASPNILAKLGVEQDQTGYRDALKAGRVNSDTLIDIYNDGARVIVINGQSRVENEWTPDMAKTQGTYPCLPA